MILDATAGNRSIYTYKNSENIIFADMEKELWIKPTIYADSRKLPFKDKAFHTVIYDPPHDWGDDKFDFKIGEWAKKRSWGRRIPFQSTYYGWDKYRNKTEIIKYLYYSQKEFARVTVDTGLLLFKWCEVNMKISRVLTVLTEWRLLVEIPVTDVAQTYGGKQTYWLILEKNQEHNRELDAYIQTANTTQADTSSAAYGTLTPFAQAHQAQQQSSLQQHP